MSRVTWYFTPVPAVGFDTPYLYLVRIFVDGKSVDAVVVRNRGQARAIAHAQAAHYRAELGEAA